MTEREAIISHIEDCKHRINVIQEYVKTNKDANVKKCERNIFVLNNAVKALKRQIAVKPIFESWCPAKCPSCDCELSESLGDGYYKHHITQKVCECGQRLDWENKDAE